METSSSEQQSTPSAEETKAVRVVVVPRRSTRVPVPQQPPAQVICSGGSSSAVVASSTTRSAAKPKKRKKTEPADSFKLPPDSGVKSAVLRPSPEATTAIHEYLKRRDSMLYDIFAAVDKTKRRGDSRRDIFKHLKHVPYKIRDMCEISSDHELADIFGTDDLLRYIHHEFNDAANFIEQTCQWVNLLNNEGRNDNRRIAACACISQNERLKILLHNLLYVLRRDKLFGDDSDEMFATSSSGEIDSINLLMSLENCTRQREHYDFNPDAFQPVLDYDDAPAKHVPGSYLRFQGASLFINYSWDETQSLDLDSWDKKNKCYECIKIPPMSLLVISGDLKHAGSANPSNTKRTRKFFLYLDPFAGVRERAVNSKKYKGGYVFFDYSCKTAGGVTSDDETQSEGGNETEELEETVEEA